MRRSNDHSWTSCGDVSKNSNRLAPRHNLSGMLICVLPRGSSEKADQRFLPAPKKIAPSLPKSIAKDEIGEKALGSRRKRDRVEKCGGGSRHQKNPRHATTASPAALHHTTGKVFPSPAHRSSAEGW